MPAPVPMRLALRLDAGGAVGLGHLSRCRAVADAVSGGGGRCSWFGRFGAGVEIPAAATRLAGEPTMAAIAPEEVAAFARDAADADWLLLDHYGIGEPGIAAARAAAPRAAIAVFADHQHPVGTDIRIAPAEQAADGVLGGLDHAPLREAFWLERCRRSLTPTRRAGTVVCFGGADTLGLTRRCITAAASAGEAVTIVAGDAIAAAQGIDALLPSLPAGSRRVAGLDAAAMAALVADTAAALVACSSIALEAACLGARTVAVPWTDNQRPLARALGAAGIEVVDDVSAAAEALARARSVDAIDGLGAWRIAAGLGFDVQVPLPALPGGDVRVEAARDGDRAAVWLLNTLADYRRVSHHRRAIPWADHCRWWARDRGFEVVARIATMVVGYARAADGLVSVVVHPAARGRGIASGLLGALVERGQPLRAEILPGNAGSLALFRGAGFVPAPIAGEGGATIVRHPGRGP